MSNYQQTEQEKTEYWADKERKKKAQAEKKSSNQQFWKNHPSINSLKKFAKANS